MPDLLFRDRRDAGRFLAGLLEEYRGRTDVIVLGLPRGGVPVAYEVATALGAPLDVFLVRKLGAPGREELAMGAIASGGVMVINDDVVRGLAIAPEAIHHAAEREGRELVRREQAYREGRPFPAVAGKVVIVVDDGLATGSSMRAAIEALRSLRPARIVVAVPAAPQSTCRELTALADEVVCATTPSPFFAVGSSYWNFTQTTDEEVRDLLRAASGSRPAAGTAPGPTEVAVIRAEAIPVEEGTPADQVLFDLVGDARLVLIGEASHGTSEFYAARAEITRRLIEDRGFGAVAAEADWPDAYRVNRYVRDGGDDATAEEALRGFERFPTWMRPGRDERAKAGFYGLDLYGLYRSLHEVVWAHNSHLGDARATETAARGELNVGQLVRERHPADCRLIGFTTYTGTVTAASDWEGPAEREWVRPALADSVEELLHEVGEKEFMLRFGAASGSADALRSARLERAIGVIYRPETERQSHYFRARLADQFDAVIHIDETRAVEPLERTARWQEGEAPETYPFAV